MLHELQRPGRQEDLAPGRSAQTIGERQVRNALPLGDTTALLANLRHLYDDPRDAGRKGRISAVAVVGEPDGTSDIDNDRLLAYEPAQPEKHRVGREYHRIDLVDPQRG